MSAIQMVYDRDLHFVRHIEHHSMGLFWHICKCIRVLTKKEATYVPLAAMQSERQNQASNHCSTCIAGQYLTVTNWHSHCVSVFTFAGNYVISFGQLGSKEGDFNTPCGVGVDNDSFVFVADCGNNKLT